MSYFDDHFDRFDDDRDEEPSVKTCRYCRKHGLEWIHTGKNWRLQEPDGALHSCGKAIADDFDDLS